MDVHQNAGVPLNPGYPSSPAVSNNFVFGNSYPMGAVVNERGVPMGLQYNHKLLVQSRALKALCVCELLFAIWTLFLGGGFLLFIVFIPSDILGIVGSQRLHKKMLAAFMFYKMIIFLLSVVFYADIAVAWGRCSNCGSENGEVSIVTVIWVLLITFQLICLILAMRIRQGLMQAECALAENVELRQVAASQQQVQPTQQQHQQQQQQQMIAQQMMVQQQMMMAQQQQMGQQPVAFPYPSHFMQPSYPYMGQPSAVPQGYPVVMPYPMYPPPQQTQQVVSTYPTYAISDDESHPDQVTSNQPLLRQ